VTLDEITDGVIKSNFVCEVQPEFREELKNILSEVKESDYTMAGLNKLMIKIKKAVAVYKTSMNIV
jgi:hypothetical protein